MSRHSGHWRPVLGAAVGTSALLLAGCGDSGSSEDAGPGASPGGTPATGTQMQVTLTDFRVELPGQPLTPGTYSFDVTNDGQVVHALEVEGQGVEETTDTLQAGQEATLTVSLPAGTFTFYCPVGDHRAQGMETTVTVGG